MVVLVHGEAGIGKTALLRRFCAEAGESVRVLWATCDPLFTPRPLGPLLDIARLDRRRAAGAGRGRRPAIRGGRALIDELDRRSPSVVVVEDLHWADEATLDVLRAVRAADRLGAGAAGRSPIATTACSASHPLRMMLGELPSALSAASRALALVARRRWRRWRGASTVDCGRAVRADGRQPVLRDRGAGGRRRADPADGPRRGARALGGAERRGARRARGGRGRPAAHGGVAAGGAGAAGAGWSGRVP